MMQSEVHHAYIEGSPDQIQKAIFQMDEIVKEIHYKKLRDGMIDTSNRASQQSRFAVSSSFPPHYEPAMGVPSHVGLGNSFALSSGYQQPYYGHPQQQFQGSEGSTDYTRQWIEYYHAIGDFQQAEALRESLRQGEMMLFQRSGASGFA